MTTEPMTKEQIKAVLREAFKARPRRKPPPASKAQLAEVQLAGATKPTVAIAQDVALSSDALAQRLRDERGQTFTDREIAIRQAALDRAIEATRGFQREIVFVPYHTRSITVGRGDSDADLHVSPEDQLWGRK